MSPVLLEIPLLISDGSWHTAEASVISTDIRIAVITTLTRLTNN